MLQADQTIILIVVMFLFGFANVFFGRDIFRPLLIVYGFAGGALLAGAVADYTNTEASMTAVLVLGGIFALLSFVIFYLGIAVMGAGVGVLFISMIATAFNAEPAPLLLIIVAVVCGGLALAFHDYVLMFATALGGSLIVAQAVYLFFPDTQARFSLIEGLEFVEVSTGAMLIGAIIIVILTMLGSYMQWKSYQDHKHQDY